MPRPNSSGWLLDYDDPRSNARILISLPTAMLRDLRVLAHERSLSVAELVRRAVSYEIATELQNNPEDASFKGKLRKS